MTRPRSESLRADSRRHSRCWLVIGTRADGSRLVLAEDAQREEAERLARIMREQLENYAGISVEWCVAAANGRDG